MRDDPYTIEELLESIRDDLRDLTLHEGMPTANAVNAAASALVDIAQSLRKLADREPVDDDYFWG